LEFTGPLALAMLSSRRRIDFVWIALAVVGLLMLLPLQGRAIMIRRARSMRWARVFVGLSIFSSDRSRHGSRSRGVAAAVAIAAILVVPIAIAEAGANLFQPSLIVPGLGIAILSTALPYSLEMAAMTRLPAKTFGTLMSFAAGIRSVVRPAVPWRISGPTPMVGHRAIIGGVDRRDDDHSTQSGPCPRRIDFAIRRCGKAQENALRRQGELPQPHADGVIDRIRHDPAKRTSLAVRQPRIGGKSGRSISTMSDLVRESR